MAYVLKLVLFTLRGFIGTWLVLLGRWGDLSAFARELARLKAKELPRLRPQLLACVKALLA